MAGHINPNSLRQKIEDLLSEFGPHTLSEIVEEFPDATIGGISATLCLLRDAHKVYVKDWTFDSGIARGGRKYPRPVWDHASNCPYQPPRNKRRPLPESNAVRLKQRRLRRAGTMREYLFKVIKRPKSTGCSTVEQGHDHAQAQHADGCQD